MHINLMGGSLKAMCLHVHLGDSSYKGEIFNNSKIWITPTASRKSNRESYLKDFILCLHCYFYMSSFE